MGRAAAVVTGCTWQLGNQGQKSFAVAEFSYCPDCGKKGVHFRFAKVIAGEDGYGCRYCSFWFFTASDRMEMDRENEARWRAYNADVASICGIASDR